MLDVQFGDTLRAGGVPGTSSYTLQASAPCRICVLMGSGGAARAVPGPGTQPALALALKGCLEPNSGSLPAVVRPSLNPNSLQSAGFRRQDQFLGFRQAPQGVERGFQFLQAPCKQPQH